MRFRVSVIALTALASVGFYSGRTTTFAQEPATTTTAAPAAATTAAAGTKTQWDGVYNEVQAKRGEPLYANDCASCHGAALDGTMGPPLAGGDFSANWNDLSLGELFERIRSTMPQQNPGSLTREQTADILAFMLQRNGAPMGTTELPNDAETLNTIKYKTQKP